MQHISYAWSMNANLYFATAREYWAMIPFDLKATGLPSKWSKNHENFVVWEAKFENSMYLVHLNLRSSSRQLIIYEFIVKLYCSNCRAVDVMFLSYLPFPNMHNLLILISLIKTFFDKKGRILGWVGSMATIWFLHPWPINRQKSTNHRIFSKF